MKCSGKNGSLVSTILVLALMILACDAQAVVLVDDHFTSSTIDTSKWITRVPQNPPTDDVFSGVGGTNLNVINTDAGGFWGNGVGIWSNTGDGGAQTTPLFDRPTTPTDEVNAYFFGVDPQGVLIRGALGLSSFNAAGEGTGNPQTAFNFPDGDGQGEYLSYSYWFRPDDGPDKDKNWVRTKTVNNAAAATNGNAEQIWSLTAPARDFRIRVLQNDIEWYMRLTADANQDPNNPWLLIGNEPVSNPQDGSEPGGRDSFRVFVHGSAAASDGAAVWGDANLLVNRILVTTTIPEPGTLSLLGIAALFGACRRRV